MDCKCTCHHISEISAQLVQHKPNEAQSIIDCHIAGLQSQLHSLKTLRNRHSLISSLPSEVLSAILIEAVQPQIQYSPLSWTTHVQLSAVCKLWREIALGCPGFWSCIPIIPNPKIDVMLARSKQHPFSIRIDRPLTQAVPAPSVLSPLLQELLDSNRLRELHLRGGRTFIEQHLEGFPVVPSALQSLSLYNTEHGHYLRLPSWFFSSPKPILQVLRLYGCTADWNAITLESTIAPITVGLLELTLQDLHPPPPLTFLTGLLSSSPNLQVLELRDALPDDVPRCPTNEDKGLVNMPCLSRYTICDSLVSAVHFRSWISHPQWTEVDMVVDNSNLDEQEEVDMVRTLLGFLNVLKSSPIHPTFQSLALQIGYASCKLELSVHRIYQFHRETAFSQPSRSMSPDGPTIQLLFKISVAKMLVTDLHVLGLKSLTIMSKTTDELTPSIWRGFFHRHAMVKNLYFHGNRPHLVLDALSSALTRAEHGGEDSNTKLKYEATLPLPFLEGIILDDVIFNDNWRLEDHECPEYQSIEQFFIDRWNYYDTLGTNNAFPRLSLNVLSSLGLTDNQKQGLSNVAGVHQFIWVEIDELDEDSE
jgi:hypothetical protein